MLDTMSDYNPVANFVGEVRLCFPHALLNDRSFLDSADIIEKLSLFGELFFDDNGCQVAIRPNTRIGGVLYLLNLLLKDSKFDVSLVAGIGLHDKEVNLFTFGPVRVFYTPEKMREV